MRKNSELRKFNHKYYKRYISFRKKNNAKKEAEKWRGKGYNVRIIREKIAGRWVYSLFTRPKRWK